MPGMFPDMNLKKENIAVIYIAWLPFGLAPLRSFIESYQQHPAGKEHELTILFKGIDAPASAFDPFHQLLQHNSIRYNALYHSKGLDVDTYFYVASQVNATYCMFFNSRSVLLADNWLSKMAAGFDDATTGVISATGSWQSHYSTVFTNYLLKWETGKSFRDNFRKYKLFVKAFFVWRFYFKPFPSAHVRTNAFMMHREVFLSLEHKEASNKFDAYLFEGGRNSLTTQLLKKGLKPLLIDKEGKLFEINEWDKSFVFRRGVQQGLMVADNQTVVYAEADQHEKRNLTFLAWGKYE